MSTPIETNTEKLEQIVNRVYNLPNIGGSGGSSEPDLVIGLNTENVKLFPDTATVPTRNFPTMTTDDIIVLSGSVSATAEKVKQGLPVKVSLKVVHFYWDNAWIKSVADASHVLFLSGDADYPNEGITNLTAAFFVSKYGTFAPAHPLFVQIAFEVATEKVSDYKVYELATV